MGKRGFTLVEALIVIVVIGIIAGFGVPRLRGALLKSNVRSARSAMVTLVAKARAAAVARGCRSTMSFTSGPSGTVAISVCTVSGTGTEILGGVDSLAARYKVAMTASTGSLQFDPRGLTPGSSGMSVLFTTGKMADTVFINPLGKVVRP